MKKLKKTEQKKLTELANWLGYEVVEKPDDYMELDCVWLPEMPNSALRATAFQPLTHDNQLNMLEDKMLEEIRQNHQWQVYVRMECFKTDGFCCRVMSVPKDTVLVCGDNGVTKNEARVSMVYNYLQSKETEFKND